MSGFNDLRYEIRSATHEAFEGLVADLLGALMPRILKSARLGDLDCLGIDVHQYDDATDAVTLAIQCKGLQVAFDESHLKACKREVQKYLKVGPAVREYWLVVNKAVRRELRKELEAELQTLVTQKKVTAARLLDLDAFVGLLRDFARENLERWSHQSQAALKAEYAKRLEVVSYIDTIPYEVAFNSRDLAFDGKALCTSIAETTSDYLARIHIEHIGKDRVPPRFLITASFGFGKTSTMHAVADRWLSQGRHVIYAPASVLPPGAFVNGAELAAALLTLIIPDDFEATDLARRILRETFRKEVAKSTDWLLLIDGIDESPFWDDQNRLSALWGGVADLGLPLVASVRDELFQLRRREFEDGDGRSLGRPFFSLVGLEDWPDDLILEFIRRFEVAREGPAPDQFGRLRSLVTNGAYDEVYGDLPKRPLFLGMIAEDAWQDTVPERELHRLYGKYLRNKLRTDRYSAGSGRIVRSGQLVKAFGQDEAEERIMRAMQAIAGALHARAQIGGDSALVTESELIAAIPGSPHIRADEVALNSLLQPAGRSSEGERLFRFAHQSFQDWFVARWLVETGADWKRQTLSEATRSFAIAMTTEP